MFSSLAIKLLLLVYQHHLTVFISILQNLTAARVNNSHKCVCKCFWKAKVKKQNFSVQFLSFA